MLFYCTDFIETKKKQREKKYFYTSPHKNFIKIYFILLMDLLLQSTLYGKVNKSIRNIYISESRLKKSLNFNSRCRIQFFSAEETHKRFSLLILI